MGRLVFRIVVLALALGAAAWAKVKLHDWLEKAPRSAVEETAAADQATPATGAVTVEAPQSEKAVPTGQASEADSADGGSAGTGPVASRP